MTQDITACLYFVLSLLTWSSKSSSAFVVVPNHQQQHWAPWTALTTTITTTTTTSTTTISSLPVPPATATPTALGMGMFEDMLSGRDASQRDKENVEYLTKLQERVERINALEPDVEDLSDEELQAKTKEFQQRLAEGQDLNDDILEEAFALVREAAW